ncbi:MAG: hypothetical protein A3E36_02455 [Candidatus Andersenbacteria bacterium RIFCSPHIGHO2_12_FULL_45_11b]|uniref:Addiction module toxin RelE n=1 Tax=Candidatus Andersenbacteria bacterium RIFCSPHIGHO2_12_FULL_45_11b TaxID=1797282 RepID=A0A1G1XBL0_9BACT|nr:MAG: hypothetical protein A3E36_02455 [Candidatus Andersenbacteria bacterium RIFCSPHIGHO2_12_FULL_45_11b]
MEKQVQINYTRNFIRQLEKSPAKIKSAFLKRRELFQKDPYNHQLRNHALSGKRKGLRSINVTGDWRALYEEQNNSKQLYIIALFRAIGTHSQLYK